MATPSTPPSPSSTISTSSPRPRVNTSTSPSSKLSTTASTIEAAEVDPTVAVVAPAFAPTEPAPATHVSSPTVVVAGAPAPTSASASLDPCVLRKYYTCTAPDSEQVLQCERDNCPKAIHRTCSLRVTEPYRDPTAPVHVVCGKRCYNAIAKGRSNGEAGVAPFRHDASSSVTTAHPAQQHHHQRHSGERKKRSPWNSDGPSDSVNSLSVLLAWLGEPTNYARWVNGGDESKFETKASLTTEILDLIRANGIPTDRNRNDVFAKIYLIEKSFGEAAAWVAQNEGKIDDASLAAGARKRCKWYTNLVGSMGIKHSGKRNSAASFSHHGGATRKRAAPVAFDADTGAAIKHQHIAPAQLLPLQAHDGDGEFNRAAADLRAAVEAHVASEALNAASQEAFLQTSKPAVSDRDAVQAHYVQLQAVAEKFQTSANAAAVAASTALLRARAMLLDEGVPQNEIDAALPLARTA